MWNLLRTRALQGYRTVDYPNGPPKLPSHFRGRPVLEGGRCAVDCRACAAACPTAAIALEPLRLDLGACLFCGACAEACPAGALSFGTDHRLAGRRREELVVGSGSSVSSQAAAPGGRALLPVPAVGLEPRLKRLFGRSLKLRQVSAGGCNACEADLNVLGTIVYDLGRFGIQFVASPRHADGIVVTGPVTRNMHRALIETYEATPSPRLVIAVGACAASGGPFAGSEAQEGGVPAEIPVDLYIPGCPPHPVTILDGLLRLIGRIEEAAPAPPPNPEDSGYR